jgi:pimeloyl-ACP methyl ester carboxylesterase
MRPESAPGQFISIEGAKIFYLDSQPQGDSSYIQRTPGYKASPLILIHGLGASTFSFRRNIPELSRQARVVALDLKGFGFSKDFSSRDFSFEAEARIVVALMDALNIPKATLVGQSLGGSIAALVAALHPDRVDHLVLIDSATLYITRPFVTRLLHGRVLSEWAYQLGGPNRGRVRKLLLKAYADKSKVTDADVEGYYFPFTIKKSAEALRLFLTTRNPNDNALLAHIQAPTLILWGAQDTFLDPSVKEFLHQQIRNSKLLVIPNAGHAVMEEKPEAVNQAIADFIESGGVEKR